MIQWNDSFVTGHPLVDNDHRQLIASLNELELALQEGAGKEQISQVLSFLNRYTREHFRREEAHMKHVNCPAYDENCREHDALVAKLDHWATRLNQGVSTSLVLEVHREVAAWVRSHIVKTDCKLRACGVREVSPR
jgi:hemerythrin-like metal-binding protein